MNQAIIDLLIYLGNIKHSYPRVEVVERRKKYKRRLSFEKTGVLAAGYMGWQNPEDNSNYDWHYQMIWGAN